MGGVTDGPIVRDHERNKLVYAAQEYAEGELAGEDDYMGPEALPEFLRTALAKAGWEVTAQPEVALDVVDDSAWSGWVGADETIHLHPRVLSPGLVLHELAHWLRPLDAHGPEFCGVLLKLLSTTLGSEAGEAYKAAFAEFGVTVDWTWYDD